MSAADGPQGVPAGLTVVTGDGTPRDPLPSIVQALSAVAADVGAIPKDDDHGAPGEYGHFKYRGIERIMAAVAPALVAHGVIVLPRVVDREVAQKPRGNNNNLWDHVRLTVEYDFYGPAGDHLTARVVAEGLDNGDKASPKALTMAYKSALLQVLGIADDAHDPDRLNPADEGPAPARRPQAARTTGTAKKAPAKKVGARVPASKKAVTRRLTVEELVRPLLEAHGPEHAATVALLLDRLNQVPVDSRNRVKSAFVEAFGLPTALTPDKVEDAAAWVQMGEAEGWPTVLSGPAPDPTPEG